jgi:hypothetical protein
MWQAGWLDASVVDEGTCPVVADDVKSEARRHRGDARRVLFDVSGLLPSADEVGEAIGLSPSQWPKRCYEVAGLVAKSGLLQSACDAHGPIRLCYGLYDGPISAASPFALQSMARHGWLEIDSGPVIDPTRWVFTATAPVLAVVGPDDYDYGAFRAKAATRGSARLPPPFEAKTALDFPCTAPVAHAFDRVLGQAGRVGSLRKINHAQAALVGAMHPASFGSTGVAVFETLLANGFLAHVPTDTREMLFGEPAVAPRPRTPSP